MTDTSKEATLESVCSIRYPVQFWQKNDKDKNKDVRALINSESKVNTMHPAYATKLGFRARKIDVGVQMIDRSHLDTFGIFIVDCSVKDNLGRVQFF